MTNRFEAVVESADARDSHAWLRVGKSRLASRLWPGIRRGAKVVVAVAPEDVLLCAGHPGRTSARNVLPGHVRAVRRTPAGSLVRVDVGFPLSALVTERAVRDLELRPGREVFALVKAVAVGPERPVESPFRACPVGPGGPVLPKEVDFLREIARAGSLSAAARELGINYRTAWMRARAVNRRWGKPLVAPVRGGRGGGGSALTPEGRGLLGFVASLERRRR